MILEGSISSEKTQKLIGEYVKLLNSNVPSSKILVLVQNSNAKNEFIEKTLSSIKIDSVEKLQVYSFFGLVYNTISENWAFLENSNQYVNPVILPNLVGLEISQYILKDILSEMEFKGYNSKKSLLHQLFRRYSLIIQNNLSDKEVDERSKILKESFTTDAKIAIKKLLKKTLQLRGFDYLRQILLFNFIYKNSNYFDGIEYLILDDGDEITPVCMDFISSLKNLKDVFIAYDKLGSSRTGYLSADKKAPFEFEKTFNQQVQCLESNSKLKDDANILFENVINDKNGKLKHFSVLSPSKRATMIDLAIKQIKELIKSGANPSDISIVTPIIDGMLKFSLKEQLPYNIVSLSGSEKLIQNKLVHTALIILKLNTELKEELTQFDIRVILTKILDIPIKYCKNILDEFDKTHELIPYDFNDEDFNEKYNKLLNLIQNLSQKDKKLSWQVYEIYEEIFEYVKPDEINKFNFLIKQLRDFENIFGEDFNNRKKEIIRQIENSIISENPYSILTINKNDILISTPQKIIDNKLQTKYQIWLDISSDEWIKSDIGPLYNAWVFQKSWDKDSYTIEDNILLSKDKTARILRKLTLCTSEHIFAYSSLFDSNGVENFGGIEKYINFEEETKSLPKIKPITPRDDQKPVLDYKSGKMAISAVPGAGKTTILLALILKIMENDVNPENIFVLTYMESAARNFKDRIKTIRPNTSQLPNISTIHGLALRIIKSNNNYERLGLNSDFDICDDTQRGRIINEISASLKLKPKQAEEYDRAISIFKLGNGSFNSPKLDKFKTFFETYQNILKSQNLIDYDDILNSSVKLLKGNPDILEYYQEICQYIIEDEAQDSSAIQQELITLLSGKYGNLIRCGDINQAITTTFSNADVEGFRRFITDNYTVSMNCSQRCTKDVWQLANNLVDFADTKTEAKNAFYKIYMQPVENKNPIENDAVTSKIFKTPLEEKNYILKTIKNALAKNKDATIGILLRSNYQTSLWMSYINDSGLKCITRTECLEQKTIFKTIFSILQIIINPFDNENLALNYEILAELGLYKQRLGVDIKASSQPFIEQNCDDIINPELCRFYWDVMYWLSMPDLSADEIAVKIGLTYFSSEIEISNVYLISTLIKRLSITNSNLIYVTNRLGELAKKTSLSGFKFFSEEDESNKEFFKGKIQIMTLHKSKGDEFDLVFIPEMTEKSLTLDINEIKLKSSDFIEDVRRTSPTYKPKTVNDMKCELISENYRLLYVAITRAKRKLYMTSSLKSVSYGKEVNQTPSIIFDELTGVQYE